MYVINLSFAISFQDFSLVFHYQFNLLLYFP